MKLKITLIALFSCTILCSQSFREVQLPTPDKLSPLFIGPLFKSTIHYGSTPPNYNGKVIVFNHGYIDLNQGQFLFDNSFYQETYNEGYQAVFVATTRGEGIWVNGKLLAESIDIVTQKYNVPQVYLVGHSNGGKASEAAMFQYEKNDKVAKAFALGTPFWGTYLADISQMPWLNWAWKLTGLNEGARTSTTYYCRNVVRPILDNHPNNDPDKFVILGASGFYKGSTIAAAAFLATGGILFAAQGANDGVAPYRSTLRPGAEYVFEKNDSRAIFDHLDVGLGQFSWKYVKSYIENKSQKNNPQTKSQQDRFKIVSNYYIMNSENEYDKITLDKNSKHAVAEILHESPKATFQAFDKNQKKITLQKTYSDKNHNTVIPISKDNLAIQSDSRFVAFVKQNNSIKMSLEQLSKSNQPTLKVDVYGSQKDKSLLTNTVVRGIITKTSAIDGTPEQHEPEIIEFDQKDGSFYFNSSTLEDGVYSLFLNSESENNFKRSIISGFVVGDIKTSLNRTARINRNSKTDQSIMITPNAVKNQASLHIHGYNLANGFSVKVYDVNGKVIKTFNIKAKQHEQYNISQYLGTLSPGIYLLKVNDYQSTKFVKQ